MSKQEFLAQLKVKLSGLPKAEVEEHLAFYSEMIDDRMEEGQTEEDALSDIGSVDDIAKQIIADIPLIKIAKERMTPKRRLKVWEVVLLALGSPIWLSLGVAAIAVLLSLYIALCAVVVSVWAAFVSLVGCGVGGVIALYWQRPVMRLREDFSLAQDLFQQGLPCSSFLDARPPQKAFFGSPKNTF